MNTSEANAVIQVFKVPGDEHPFAEVVSLARKSVADDASIKAAIWRLRSEGRLEVTQDWKVRLLRIPEAAQSNKAAA